MLIVTLSLGQIRLVYATPMITTPMKRKNRAAMNNGWRTMQSAALRRVRAFAPGVGKARTNDAAIATRVDLSDR
jgi:hypothetical protein